MDPKINTCSTDDLKDLKQEISRPRFKNNAGPVEQASQYTDTYLRY